MRIGTIVKIVNPNYFYVGRLAQIERLGPLNTYWVCIQGTNVRVLVRENEIENSMYV